jgi:hypothetical protein
LPRQRAVDRTAPRCAGGFELDDGHASPLERGEHTASVHIYVGDRGRYGATAYGYLLWTYVGAHLADYPDPLHIVTLGKKPEIMP